MKKRTSGLCFTQQTPEDVVLVQFVYTREMDTPVVWSGWLCWKPCTSLLFELIDADKRYYELPPGPPYSYYHMFPGKPPHPDAAPSGGLEVRIEGGGYSGSRAVAARSWIRKVVYRMMKNDLEETCRFIHKHLGWNIPFMTTAPEMKKWLLEYDKPGDWDVEKQGGYWAAELEEKLLAILQRYHWYDAPEDDYTELDVAMQDSGATVQNWQDHAGNKEVDLTKFRMRGVVTVRGAKRRTDTAVVIPSW